MGFLDAQLSQGYAINYAVRLGFIDQEQSKAINDIQNGLELVDKLLDMSSIEVSERFHKLPREIRAGEFISHEAEDIGGRITSSFRMSSRFHLNLRFESVRIRDSESRRRSEDRQRDFRRESRTSREGRTGRAGRRAARAGRLGREAEIAYRLERLHEIEVVSRRVVVVAAEF